MRKVRRLCAVVLDTFGRELVIRREYEVDEKAWPSSFPASRLHAHMHNATMILSLLYVAGMAQA